MKERKLETFIFFALLIGAVYLVAKLFAPYFGALALAAIFAVVFAPLKRHFLVMMPGREALASVCTLLVVVVVVLLPLAFYGVILSDEIKNFYDGAFASLQGGGIMSRLTEMANGYVERLSPLGIEWPVFDVAQTENYVFQALAWVRGHFGDIFSGLAKFFIDAFIFLIAFYYFLKDGHKFKDNIVLLSPLRDRNDAMILEKLRVAIVSIVKGSILVALIQGIVSGFGFYVFGVPSAFLWAGVAAVAALIPGLGTGLVNLPIIIYLAIAGSPTQAIGMTLWAIFAVGFIDNFLGPRFVEKGVRIHPFLILMSVLGGLSIFGPLGFMFGPIALAFLFALLDIYKTILVKEETDIVG